MAKRSAEVRIHAPKGTGYVMTRLAVGDYFWFQTEDPRAGKTLRWERGRAYQYLGKDGGQNSKYARVLDVETGHKFRAPLRSLVRRLELVAIDLRPLPLEGE